MFYNLFIEALAKAEALTKEKKRNTKRAWNGRKYPNVKFVADFGEYLTVTGKIQKRKLQEALIKELGLEHLTKIKTA